jgi:alkanesulfonate monooxygenase SsuD/methylene tetrahydromethanopterin reductase-like flavin-dependent oxidoreductase (luciferase family)
MRVGLVVMDENPADALKIVRAAERAGVHSLWTIDYYNRSSLTRAAAFAAVSETAIVGTSVTPLFARSPLALAAAAADVQALAGGRFVLGVGSSTRRMNQDWYGTALQHPAPQVREPRPRWVSTPRRRDMTFCSRTASSPPSAPRPGKPSPAATSPA